MPPVDHHDREPRDAGRRHRGGCARVDGYNHYLESGKLRDPTCKGKPWVAPITLTDMLLRGEQIVTAPSAQQFITGLDQAAPPSGAAEDARAATVNADRSIAEPGTGSFAALKAQFEEPEHQDGSNGIGLGARDTQSGDGMVLANPHFPWVGPDSPIASGWPSSMSRVATTSRAARSWASR